LDKSGFFGTLHAGVIARWLFFSGERTRPRVHISAPRRNASLVQRKKVVGEAPTTAREGACAPQTSVATTTTSSSV